MNITNNIHNKSTFTIWWIQLVVFIMLFDFFEFLVASFNMKESQYLSIMYIMKGMACISGSCIFLGYWTFAFLFFIMYKKSFQYELYVSNCFNHEYSYPFFLTMDVICHILLVFLIYQFWNFYAYTNSYSIYGTFLFHRLWSLYASQYKTIYFLELQPIYRFGTNVHQNLFRITYFMEGAVLAYYFSQIHLKNE